jgi:hypothetical protein
MSSQWAAQNLAKKSAQDSKRFFHIKYKAIQAAAAWARAEFGGMRLGITQDSKRFFHFKYKALQAAAAWARADIGGISMRFGVFMCCV